MKNVSGFIFAHFMQSISESLRITREFKMLVGKKSIPFCIKSLLESRIIGCNRPVSAVRSPQTAAEATVCPTYKLFMLQ